jgi:hypothetical protein
MKKRSVLLKRLLDIVLFLTVIFVLLPSKSGAQWVHTNGPYGGNARALAVSGSKVFAGFSNGGVYRSNNNGNSWVQFKRGLANVEVHALMISIPSTAIIAGTRGKGVFISSTTTANWSPLNSGLSNRYVETLVKNSSYIFAGTNGGGVYCNISGSWVAVNRGLTNRHVHALAVGANGATIFAGTDGGVFRRTTNGWTSASTGIPSGTAISAIAVNGTNLFATTVGPFGRIYRSTNNGGTWTQVGSGDTYEALAFVGANIYVGSDKGVACFTNGGTSWQDMGENFPVHILASSGSYVYAGTPVGVFRSAYNHTNWSSINTGLPDTEVKAIAGVGSSLFAGTASSGVFCTTNSGNNWIPVNGRGAMNSKWDGWFWYHGPYSVTSFAFSGSNIYAGTYYGVFHSSDNGANWTRLGGHPYGEILALSLAVSGSSLMVGTVEGGVHGCTIDVYNCGESALNSGDIYALAVDGTTVYAGVGELGVACNTSSGNETWTYGNNGLTNKDVRALAVSGSTVYAGTYGGGVYLSSDGGTNWTQLNTDLTSTNVYALAISGSTVFAGTDDGIFAMMNGNASWIDVSTGLTDRTIRSLAVFGSELFAGTTNRGVWRRPLSDF